jgi:parallel beta-helix repeat protein
VTFRYASGDTSGKPPRIYITGPGSAMLSDVRAAVPSAPLAQTAPGIWHLKADLFIENGATLVLHGTKIGGDVNELRMKSNNTSDDEAAIVSITADWGDIDIRSTRITSWDDAVDGPDTEYTLTLRAFIRVRSSLEADGVTTHESRMDIIDSDVGYLGTHNAESYGLTWKVIADTNVIALIGNITNLYNLANVYGDIKNSRLHHNFFGVYTFGHYGGQWINNEVDHNVWYGFDPHDDSDTLVIENNNVHHNGTHGIIASQRCNNLIIRNNTSWNNGGAGIMLHRYSDDALVENNKCIRNGDAGIAIFDSFNNVIRQNTCLNNVRAGIRFSVGASDNLIEDNEFAFSDNFGIYLYKGSDAPKPGEDGRPRRNRFLRNRVHNNSSSGIFLTSANDNIFRENLFYANFGPMWFVNAKQNLLDSNSVPAGVVIRTQGNPGFGSTTVLRNQPAVTIQVDSYSSATLDDALGRAFDPEEDGINAIITPSGSTLTVTASEITKDSIVWTRNLQVVPNAGLALIDVTIWNTSGDLAKRWSIQAGNDTQSISYRVGDLAPNTAYNVTKNGQPLVSRTSDGAGFISFQDTSVDTGTVEFIVMR